MEAPERSESEECLRAARLERAARATRSAAQTARAVESSSPECARERKHAPQWRLCLLLTRALCRLPWETVLQQAIDAGIDCVQVREPLDREGHEDDEGPTAHDEDLTKHINRVIELAHPRGVAVIVNDRVDLAIGTGADGVHLGQGDMPIAEARRRGGEELLIGASTHTLDEARRVIEIDHASYCGVGMMFPSTLKPDLEHSGPAYLRAFLDHYPDVPHLAIGGITPDNVDELVYDGCRGVAVSSAICGAEEPGRVVDALLRALAGRKAT